MSDQEKKGTQLTLPQAKWWVQLLVAALSGGVFSAFISGYIGGKEIEYGSYQNILERLDMENIQLRKDNDELRDRLTKLQSDLSDIKTQVILLESSHQDLPFPMWVKALNGRMLSLNKAYERVFLKPMGLRMSDYVGHFDADVWPDSMAAIYRANDMKVVAHGLPVIEDIEFDGQTWVVIKYARRVDKTMIGVMGVAIPADMSIIAI